MEIQENEETLDGRFFKSLKSWVANFDTVKFKDEGKKNSVIIGMINKLVFVQLLDDLGAIPSNILQLIWQNVKSECPGRHDVLLGEFFKGVDKWFHMYCDARLFKINEMDEIAGDGENLKEFRSRLEALLGFGPKSDFMGITQFRYAGIDEDIIGRAYEEYLAKERQEKGIFYTRRYVTEYMAGDLVSSLFRPLVLEFNDAVVKGDLARAESVIDSIIGIKILDPAAGSGSFLIKCFKQIWNEYLEIDKGISSLEKKMSHVKRTGGQQARLDLDRADEKGQLASIEGKVKYNRPTWIRIAAALARHIYGVDLDPGAVEACKLNLWSSAIKTSPKDYHFERIPAGTSSILPDLDLNIRHGDSIVQISPLFVEAWKNDNKADVDDYEVKRRAVLEDTLDPEGIEGTKRVLNRLRESLWDSFSGTTTFQVASDEKLQRIAKSTGLRFPFSYSLEFPGKFDGIIGNPPYVSYETIQAPLRGYFDESVYPASAVYRFDYFGLFCELTSKLLKEDGAWSFIIKNSLLTNETFYRLRYYLVTNDHVKTIIKMPDTAFKGPSVETIIISAVFRPEYRSLDLLKRNGWIEKKTYRDLPGASRRIKPHEDSAAWTTRVIIFPNKIALERMDFSRALKQLEIPQNRWLNEHLFRFVLELTDEMAAFFGLMTSRSRDFEDYLDVSQGATFYDSATGQDPSISALSARGKKGRLDAGAVENRPFHITSKTSIPPDPEALRLLKGESIQRFYHQWDGESWAIYNDRLAAPRDPKYFKTPHVLVREILTGRLFLRIFSTFTQEPFVNGHDIINIVKKDNAPPGLTLEYVNGLLNSLLYTFYHRVRFLDATKVTQQTIETNQLKRFPIVPDFEGGLIHKISCELIKLRGTRDERMKEKIEEHEARLEAAVLFRFGVEKVIPIRKFLDMFPLGDLEKARISTAYESEEILRAKKPV